MRRLTMARLLSCARAISSATAPAHLAWRCPPAALAARAAPRPAGAVRALSGAPGAGSLLDVLDSELAYELAQPAELPPAPPGWELQQRPGDTRLVLARREGRERVTVELSVDEQDGDDVDDDGGYAPLGGGGAAGAADEEDDDDDGVMFSATVAKDGAPHRLVAECRSDGTYLQILHAALEPSSIGDADDGDDDEDYAYSGPVFDELDDNLQAELESYLAARGVDASLGGALKALAAAKEQTEYVGWLKKLRAFVAA